jgi:lysophospholipase L1-like esterase
MKRYIAVGDSISIDEYPRRETGIDGIGAASLFARALTTHHPEITFQNLTFDGATTDDVLHWQIPRIQKSEDPAIVTVTAGGNDLLLNLRAARPPAQLVESVIHNEYQIVDEITRKLPNALIFIGTVYDPSDGTNALYGERLEREAAWLERVNTAIRAIASERSNVRLADIHHHFLGHGLTAPAAERWYWSGLIFEPNARGAEEVAKLWEGLLPASR